jgi:hypothetical protein
MVLAVNVVNSGLVAVALASYLEQTRWWIFFGLVTTLTAARAIGWKYYRAQRKSTDLTRLWAIIATAGSGLSGLLWGISSTMLLPDNLLEQTFLAFVIGGMCAGALVSLSYYLPAFIAYVYCSALPLAAGFLLDGGKLYVAMGCMVVVFVAAVTFAAHHFNRAFLSGVRLNLDLFDRTEEPDERADRGKHIIAIGNSSTRGRGDSTAPSSEDGGAWPANREHRTRFQQPPGRHYRQYWADAACLR